MSRWDETTNGPFLYNLVAIRDLLRAAFNDSELRRFCLYRKPLAAVVTSFGSRFSLDELIDTIIQFCQNRQLLSYLLTEVAAYNPRQYEQHLEHLYESVPGVSLPQPQGSLALARQLLEQDLVDEAVTWLEKAHRIYPQDDDVRRLFAEAIFCKGVRVYIREHNLPHAKRAFEHTLALDPFHPRADLLLAEVAHQEMVRTRERRPAFLVRGLTLLFVVSCAAALVYISLVDSSPPAIKHTPTFAVTDSSTGPTREIFTAYPLSTAMTMISPTGEPGSTGTATSTRSSSTSTTTPTPRLDRTPSSTRASTATAAKTATLPPTSGQYCPNPDVCITSPLHGARLQGIVSIVGTARINDLWYYKLEFRQEGFPEWSFLHLSERPVDQGVLMNWNTTTVPAGIYYLRLVVVDQTANYPDPYVIKVMIDN